MTGSEISARNPSPTELDIIRSFGWAVVEFEETLFERYIHLSARSSLITFNDFRNQLRDMESKGYVASKRIHGKRSFKRLLVAEPKVPLEEMRLVVGSLKAKLKHDKLDSLRVSEKLVSQSQIACRDLLGALQRCAMEEGGSSVSRRRFVYGHLGNMQKSLCESEESLFHYVRTQLPGMLIDVARILNQRGPEFLLLSLRIAETNVRVPT